MKRSISMLVCLFVVVGLSARPAVAYLSADASCLDGLWQDTAQFRVDAALQLSSGFSLRIPVSCAVGLVYDEVDLFDFGVFLDYRPLHNGLFLSVSLAQMGAFIGHDKPVESWRYLNEAAIGYTWCFSPHWFVEPRLLIRDPTGTFQEEYDEISTLLPDYGRFRLSLAFGWYWSLPFEEDEQDENLEEGGERNDAFETGM